MTIEIQSLSDEERLFFRERLREARYNALADAEGFQQICFAIESLGKRLTERGVGLGSFRNSLERLSSFSLLLPPPGDQDNRCLKNFDALFIGLKEARNDAMHSGAYARHIARDAVTLCLVLEDALMVAGKSNDAMIRMTVGDFMVSTPVLVKPWHSVEYARQLMLLNSFSYLPIWHQGQWWLISDRAVAQYLRPAWPARIQLQMRLDQAKGDGLRFISVETVNKNNLVKNLLTQEKQPGLWLVVDDICPEGELIGVLSPFELM